MNPFIEFLKMISNQDNKSKAIEMVEVDGVWVKKTKKRSDYE